MCYLICIQALQIGFLTALGKLLQKKKHSVRFIAKNLNVASLIKKNIPDAKIIIKEEFDPVEYDDIINRALELEKKYSVCFAKIISCDRALGHGYLFNADRHPNMIAAWFSHERKLKEIINSFDFYEKTIEKFKPDIILSLSSNQIRQIVFPLNGVQAYSLGPIKYGGRFIWSNNTYLTNPEFLEAIRGNLKKPIKNLVQSRNYQAEAGAKLAYSKLDFSLYNLITKVVHQILLKSYLLLKGRRNKNGYVFLGWVPIIIRRYFMYRYLLKFGKKPQDLNQRRIVFVPLHLEPETALLDISPEFNNSLEMIAWISKSAAADTIIVVKENPFSLGIRSKKYYELLRQIGNVELAHPEIPSWNWINAARLVATITGTIGTEAVIFKKPVLSFGRHQAINLLPTVRFADNYASTCEGMDALLEIKPNDPDFELSFKAFQKAQIDTSFELPGFAKTLKIIEPQVDLARIALKYMPKINK